MAAEEPRVMIRRGVRAWELLTGASAIQGSPHVIGIQTTSGEIMHADLVVDASLTAAPFFGRTMGIVH